MLQQCDSTRYVSLRLHHGSRADGFTLFSVLTSTRSAALGICSVQLGQSEALRNRYAGLLFLEDARAQHSNSAEFGTKQTVSHRNNNIKQNKTLCVDVSTQISKKTKTQALLLILLIANSANGNTSCCCVYKKNLLPVIIPGTPLSHDSSC